MRRLWILVLLALLTTPVLPQPGEGECVCPTVTTSGSSISMDGKRVTTAADPTAAQDLVTQTYHDSNCPSDCTGTFGDVTGPSSSTDNALVRFNSTTGKVIQNYTSGAPTAADTGAVTIPEGLTLNEGTDRDITTTYDLTADQIFGWNDQFCGTHSKANTFAACKNPGTKEDGFYSTETIWWGTVGATCSVGGDSCETKQDCPGAETCSGGTANDTHYMTGAYNPNGTPHVMYWNSMDIDDGFEQYTFGGGTLGFYGVGATYDLKVGDASGTLRTQVSVDNTSNLALGYSGGTAFFNSKFNALDGGIFQVDGSQKIEIEGASGGDDFVQVQETEGASDTVLTITLESANNACVDWWDGATSPSYDFGICRNGANRMDITGGNVWTDDSIYMAEQADADADTAGYGQWWVNTATPNEPYFTDDAGNDGRLITSTGATTHGVMMWGKDDGAANTHDTGAKICALWGLSCAQTMEIAGGAQVCSYDHTTNYFAAMCY